MILVIGGIKGGTGKTTLATNLAVMRASKNKKVILIDADEQKSAIDWGEQRQFTINQKPGTYQHITVISLASRSLHEKVLELQNDYEDIVIDTGGRDTGPQRSALAIADKFLIPFRPRSFDIWTLGSVKRLIQDISTINPNLRCYAVMNQADPKGRDNSDAIALIKEFTRFECISTTIGNRKIFPNSASEGLSVYECEKDGKSFQELVDLHWQIYREHI